jgi:hypothetical protein
MLSYFMQRSRGKQRHKAGRAQPDSGPMGECLAGTGYEEAIVRAEISREDLCRIRKEFPVLKDRKL